MRIVAVADTHLFHDELVIPDGDVFVHAGDMCQGGSLEELERAVTWMRALPHRHKVVIAGNHDFAFLEHPEEARALVMMGGSPPNPQRARLPAVAGSLGEGFVYLQDSGATLDGLSFWGSPWQPEFNDWAFNLPRGKALADKWALIPEGTDVLVTHGPPMGVGDKGPVAGRLGCEDLLARVRVVRPRVHVFGHIHQDGGAWQHGETMFVNVTTWECERAPTVIDLRPGAISVVAPPAHRS